ncbi:MAG: hypothetical protein ACJ763_09880, partial [Bdellovibrionia bacterium]
IETSGELVRSTKFSERGTHAQDYVEIVRKRAGNITGMGIRYGKQGLRGSRLFDLEVHREEAGRVKTRLYSLLDYSRLTLFLFGECKTDLKVPEYVKVIQVSPTEDCPYLNQAVLVRPDSYIESSFSLSQISNSKVEFEA